jgi:cyanophycinase
MNGNVLGNGVVMAIGGNEDKRATRHSILAEFVRRAGGAEARIVIIPSASKYPVRRAAQYARVFRKLGVEAITAIHAERGATPDDLLKIENATGIFVTGGDQGKLMHHLLRTGCATAIVNAVRNGGGVYAGTSAGASAVAKRMIIGRTLADGSEVVEFAEGLGLVPGVIVDQHFSERQRLPRLIAAVEDHGLVGVGIDENTATVWENDGARVAGAGGVTVIQPGADQVQVLAHGADLVL